MENEVKDETLSSVPTGTEEVNLIEQEIWEAIHALAARGKSRRAIARELGLDVKTVRKWLRKEWKHQQRRKRAGVLDGQQEFIAQRAPEVGYNGKVLWRELQERGYTGSYPVLARYLAPRRTQWAQDLMPTSRFETEPGRQAQVDWGTSGVWLGEECLRCHFFVMVLGYSRRIFARAYFNERLESLLEAHAAAFAHFGGRTREILYDNPRTIVLRKDEASGVVEWNQTFKDRMDYYGVEVRLCRYYRAQTKGKVESGIKYVKRNALAGRRFRDLEELNAWLLKWCVEVADERVHGTTHERPAERFRREEAGALLPAERAVAPVLERVASRVVPTDAYVAIETNRYPVPLEWVGRTVTVRIQPREVFIGWGEEAPIRHERLHEKHRVARWVGEPRAFVRSAATAAFGPPRFDPSYYERAGEVERRPLSAYAALIEEVGA